MNVDLLQYNTNTFVLKDHHILKFWKSKHIFKQSLYYRKIKKLKNHFIFYDGPPFATGTPHYGHFVTSTIKDLVGRYWTMNGKYVNRRFGWDTHGVPIEMETEQKLFKHSKSTIKKYGIDKFNEACRFNILRYTNIWKDIITRLGRWVDFKNDYKTMDFKFMESIWWSFNHLWDSKLITKDHKVMPYSWKLSTSMSNFEANLNYKNVNDPSIFVKFKIKNKKSTYLLIWTTTPWTLPSNLAIAVNRNIEYAKVLFFGQYFIVAKKKVKFIFDFNYTVSSLFWGSKLINIKYNPIFPYFRYNKKSFKIIESNHIKDDNGTGLAHLAPNFGEDDFNVCKNEGISPINSIDKFGNFTKHVFDFYKINIKDSDTLIIKYLKKKKYIFKQKLIKHSYPYCWRSNTPLIYKALPIWLVKVVDLKQRMISINKKIKWTPKKIGEKRFGNWLNQAQDWAISRNRYWGTPIPIWNCSNCKTNKCISSGFMLEHLSKSLLYDIHPHTIDHIGLICSNCSSLSYRINEVFDCWFEAGSMPYAQNHYPFNKYIKLNNILPADFIAEGLDQTRGWFYTLLVLSTAIFNKKPFKNVVVNGLILTLDGSKMSKSKKNYPNPIRLLEKFGADVIRLYLINSPVSKGEPVYFNVTDINTILKSTIVPLFNAWSFFYQYSKIDKWSYSTHNYDKEYSINNKKIDSWILSKLAILNIKTKSEIENNNIYKIVPFFIDFINDLTNWYIRINRDRFWANKSNEHQFNKFFAYNTLFQVLFTLSKIMAPSSPIISELIYKNLIIYKNINNIKYKHKSIHFSLYPNIDSSNIDLRINFEINWIRDIVKIGRSLREKHKIKTRQPINILNIITHDKRIINLLKFQNIILIKELNVKSIKILNNAFHLSKISLTPNYKTLGKTIRKKINNIKNVFNYLNINKLNKIKKQNHVIIYNYKIFFSDIILTYIQIDSVLIENHNGALLALDTRLNKKLLYEGLIRETISQFQQIRKSSNLKFTNKINIIIFCEDNTLFDTLLINKKYIIKELLLISLFIYKKIPSNFCQKFKIIQIKTQKILYLIK